MSLTSWRHGHVHVRLTLHKQSARPNSGGFGGGKKKENGKKTVEREIDDLFSAAPLDRADKPLSKRDRRKAKKEAKVSQAATRACALSSVVVINRRTLTWIHPCTCCECCVYCVEICNVIFVVVQKQGKMAGDELNAAENAGDDK